MLSGIENANDCSVYRMGMGYCGKHQRLGKRQQAECFRQRARNKIERKTLQAVVQRVQRLILPGEWLARHAGFKMP